EVLVGAVGRRRRLAGRGDGDGRGLLADGDGRAAEEECGYAGAQCKQAFHDAPFFTRGRGVLGLLTAATSRRCSPLGQRPDTVAGARRGGPGGRGSRAGAGGGKGYATWVGWGGQGGWYAARTPKEGEFDQIVQSLAGSW